MDEELLIWSRRRPWLGLGLIAAWLLIFCSYLNCLKSSSHKPDYHVSIIMDNTMRYIRVTIICRHTFGDISIKLTLCVLVQCCRAREQNFVHSF